MNSVLNWPVQMANHIYSRIVSIRQLWMISGPAIIAYAEPAELSLNIIGHHLASKLPNEADPHLELGWTSLHPVISFGRKMCRVSVFATSELHVLSGE